MKECPGINHSTLEIWDLEECRITDKEDQCGKSFHRRFSNIKTYREEVEELIMLDQKVLSRSMWLTKAIYLEWRKLLNSAKKLGN